MKNRLLNEISKNKSLKIGFENKIKKIFQKRNIYRK